MSQGYTKGAAIDTDGTLSADSDFLIPSQKAVKTYVDNEIAELTTNVQNKTTDYPLVLTDAQDEIVATTAGTLKFTIPLNATVAFPIGTKIGFTALSTGLVYFEATVGVTIVSIDSFLGIIPSGGHAILIKIATDTWELEGDLRSVLDPDAEVFIDAVVALGGSFTGAEEGYISDFFVEMKATDDLYIKTHYCHLYMGGTSTTIKLNIVNPVDSDAAFRLTPVGSPTINANGATGNGTTQYIRTHYTPSTSASQNNKAYAMYLRSVGTNGASYGAITSGFQGDELLISYAGTTYWTLGRNDDSFAGPATKTGFWLLNRTAVSTCEIRRNDVQLDTEAGSTSVNVGFEIVYMARNRNGTPEVFSADNICFDWCGEGLTSAEATALYNACLTLQTALGRNV